MDERPVIVAVNGEGADSTMYIISVQYTGVDEPVFDIALVR